MCSLRKRLQLDSCHLSCCTEKQIFYINMLCKWYVPTDNAYLTQEGTKEEGNDVVLWKEEEEDQGQSGPTIGSNLLET